MRQQTRLQAGEERQEMAAAREQHRRMLHAVMCHQHGGAARVGLLVTVQVHDLIDPHLERVLPEGALLLVARLSALGGVAAVHQLVGRPLNDQAVGQLVQRQVARQRRRLLRRLHQHVVLAVQQGGLVVLVQRLHVVPGADVQSVDAERPGSPAAAELETGSAGWGCAWRAVRRGGDAGPLYQLVGRRVGPEVVDRLHTGVLERAGPDQQRAQDGAVVRVGDQRLPLVVLAAVLHQVVDDVGQLLFEERLPQPEVAGADLAGGALQQGRRPRADPGAGVAAAGAAPARLGRLQLLQPRRDERRRLTAAADLVQQRGG